MGGHERCCCWVGGRRAGTKWNAVCVPPMAAALNFLGVLEHSLVLKSVFSRSIDFHFGCFYGAQCTQLKMVDLGGNARMATSAAPMGTSAAR